MIKDNSSQTGRWTEEEHNLFLQGLQKYGKNWKLIEKMIQTRNGSQIRSHAQKYYLKLAKQNKSDKPTTKKSKSGKQIQDDLDIKIEDENGVLIPMKAKSSKKNNSIPTPPLPMSYPIDIEQMQFTQQYHPMYPPMQHGYYPPMGIPPEQLAEMQKTQQQLIYPPMAPYVDQPPLIQNSLIGQQTPYLMQQPSKPEIQVPGHGMPPYMFQQQYPFPQFGHPMYRIDETKLLEARKFSENIEQCSTAEESVEQQAKKQQQLQQINQQQKLQYQLSNGSMQKPTGSLLVKRKNSQTLIQGAESEIAKKQQQISTTSYSNISC